MARRGRHRGGFVETKASIDMTSLIDLTFLLLVTFMLTIPALEQGISIMLPRAKTDVLPSKNAKANTITVDVNHKIFLNDVPTTLDQLEADLKEVSGAQNGARDGGEVATDEGVSDNDRM